MAKTITAMMPDGQPVKLEGVPDDVTPDQVTARIQQEYGATPISLSREGGGNPILDTAKVYGSGLLRGVTSAGAMAKDVLRNTYEGLTQAVQGKSQPFADKFQNVAENAKLGAQPRTEAEKYVVAALEGAAAGAVGGPATLLRSAAQGAASGLGAEIAGHVSENPLSRVLGGILGGGAASLAGVPKTSRADLARETLRDAKPEDLDAATKFMREVRAQHPATSGINLAQAMPESSNVDAMVGKLANSRYGTHVSAQLRSQPKQVSAAVEGELAGLPGTVRPWQDLANNAQEAATKLIQEAKTTASDTWKTVFERELQKGKLLAGEQLKQAETTYNAAVKKLQLAKLGDLQEFERLKTAHKAQVDAILQEHQQYNAGVLAAKAEHEAKLAQPFPIPTGIGSRHGILLDNVGAGKAILNALATWEARQAQLRGQGTILGLDGVPIPTGKQFQLREAPQLPTEPLPVTAREAGIAPQVQQAKSSLDKALGSARAVTKVPEQSVQAVINRLLTAAEQAGEGTTKSTMLRQLASRMQTEKGVITDGQQLNEILKDMAGRTKPVNLSTQGLDAGASNYLQMQIAKARETFGSTFTPFRQANDAYKQVQESLVEPLKGSVVGRLAGRKGFDPAVEAASGPLKQVFERGTTPGAARSEILDLEKSLRKTNPEVFQDAALTWLAEKVTAAGKSKDGRFPEAFSERLTQAFGSPATETAQSAGLRDILAGVARARGVPETTYQSLPKLMRYVAATAKRPGLVEGASHMDFDQVAGSAVADAGRRGSLINPLRPLFNAWDRITRGDAYSFVDKLITTPEGVEVLRKAAAASSPSDRALAQAMQTFLATSATATPKTPGSME